MISHSSFIYSQRRCLSSGHHHICVLDCKVIPSGLSFNVPFSRYCRDRFFENRHQITVPPSLEPAVTLSSVLTVKLLFMINSLLYDQTLVLLPISSLLTLYLPIDSHVILDQLQGTDSAEADHKAEMGVLSFLPLDTAVSSWLTSSHPSDLSTGLFSKAFLQSSGSATPGCVFTPPCVPCYSSAKHCTQAFLICLCSTLECEGFPGSSEVKNSPAIQGMQIRPLLGWEDPLE